MERVLSIVQIMVTVLVIALILIQNRGSGAGAIFGSGGGPVHTKRGAEKWMHYATIGLIVVFALLGIASLLIQN